MFEKLRTVFSIPELRQKIFLTLFLLAIFRIGWTIYLPVVDIEAMEGSRNSAGGLGALLETVQVLSASQLSQATIFGLGIMPYISASIMFQLLSNVYQPLIELRKEGESGRKKINDYTRYVTVILCFVQSFLYVRMYLMADQGGGANLTASEFEVDGHLTFGWQIIAVLIMTSGSVFLMWLGEQIDEYGIGNGISLLIMGGILASMPGALGSLVGDAEFRLNGFDPSKVGIELLLVLAFLFIAVVASTVYVMQSQRRIPTQSAKHVRGRRVFGGTKQYMPLRMLQAGVMPIIFSTTLLIFPYLIFQFFGQVSSGDIASFFESAANAFQPGHLLYNLANVGLIFFFCFFWTAIMFNPKEIADNLKESGAFIPGHRPGKRTEEYLDRVMHRVTFVGAAFLSVIAVVPTILTYLFPNVNYMIASFYGGTGLLIAVSVSYDLISKIDSYLLMRNHKSLLE